MKAPQPGIIGRERELVEKAAKLLHQEAKRHYDYTDLRETPRGNTFGITAADGRVITVTVELSHVER